MHFDPAHLLREYGYWAVLVGTFCEGETIVLAGTWAASQGYLSIVGVALCAWLGSFAGDQFYFLMGRWVGKPWLKRRPRLARTADRVLALLSRYQSLFIIAFRFLYGLRTVAPIVLGASGMKLRVFLPLNFLGAALWALFVTMSGAALVQLFADGFGPVPSGQVASVLVALAVPAGLGLLTLGPKWRAKRAFLGRHYLSRPNLGQGEGGDPRQRLSG